MIEKGKISALQMSLLMYANLVGTGILTAPGITFLYAKQDLWLSPIWGSLSGFLVVFIVYQLNKLYPGETLIQYSQHILGRILGKVVGFVYLFFYLTNAGGLLREYGDFIVGAFLQKTPLLMVMGCLAIASAFAVRAGLEVLARLSNMFVPILFLLWLVIVLLLLPELEVKYMFPILEDGIMPSLRGSVAPLAWNTLFFFMSSLLPFLKEREEGRKWGMFTVLVVMATLVITNLATILLFGGITGSFLYPVMSAARYISYADFFENLEAVIMAIWIGGSFIQLGLYYYILVLDTSQWLKLSDYKPLALPFGLLITLFGIWATPNLPEFSQSVSVTFPFVAGTFFLVIPAALLLIAILRNRNQRKVCKS
ncbi:endospore germination permease [Ammoniphilus sp. 3BR4]|uniref:GerAB/ArcD/ProY family transporter n=1 Tax=Ammoniphilus sp. 3BR4 TaxID=3158265 RepID=UPI0034662A6D